MEILVKDASDCSAKLFNLKLGIIYKVLLHDTEWHFQPLNANPKWG